MSKREVDTRDTYEVHLVNDWGVRRIRVLADSIDEARAGARYWKKNYELVGIARKVKAS